MWIQPREGRMISVGRSSGGATSELVVRVRELQMLGQNPQVMQGLGQSLTTRSLVFEVRVKASIASTTRNYVGILRRNNPKDIQTLNLYWK